MTQQWAVILLHSITMCLVLQIIVFVMQELHHIRIAIWACALCAMVAWGCWSRGVKQSFVSVAWSIEVVLLPAVPSYVACSGWCGGGLSLLSSTVTRLERDSPRVKAWDGKPHERLHRVGVFYWIWVFKMVEEHSPRWNTEAIFQIWRKEWWRLQSFAGYGRLWPCSWNATPNTTNSWHS